MSVAFNRERWDRVRAAHRAWWDGTLDRPLIAVTIGGYESDRPEPSLPGRGFTAFYGPEVTPEQIVDRWDYDLSRCRFLGDAFPGVWPNFGPGVMAAFTGCRLECGTSTVWFHPERAMELAEVHIRFDPDSPWFQRVGSIMKAGVDRWGGLVQVGMTDLGGSLDVAASFRPGEALLLDLYDHPHEVKRVRDEVHGAWWKYFGALNEILQPVNPGYTAWTPIFSEDPYYMLQCDFAYMIGPEMFDEFVMPELAASCRRMPNAFYHLDGVGQLPHLESLLRIPELRGVQWVPGDGQPDVAHWPDVYRRILKAGKRIQVFSGQAAEGMRIVDTLAEQLGTAKGLVLIGGADRSQEGEIRELLARYGVDDGI